MEDRLRELCRKAADGARAAIEDSARVRKEGAQFFEPVEDLDLSDGVIQVTHLGGPRGEAIELSALGSEVIGSVGKVNPGQQDLLDEFVEKAPALMAARLRLSFSRLLGAGVSREDIVYHVDVAVAESVMSS
jgi:hypothetical protein